MSVQRGSVFISHSAAEVPPVAFVRDRLARRIAEGGGNALRFQVLLDVNFLRGGHEYRPILHRWLGECDAAVLLLSRKALTSDWVRVEATILTWRKSLGSHVLLIPVLIGCSRDEVERTDAFAPLSLGDIIFEQLDYAGDITHADVEDATVADALGASTDALAARVIEQLEHVSRDAEDLPMLRWVRDVDIALEEINERYLDDAAESLGVDAQARALFNDKRRTIAHHLLTVALPELYRGLSEMRPRHISEAAYSWLTTLLKPVWVHAEAARNFSVATHDPVRRTIAINARRMETGEHYINRATCGQMNPSQIARVNDVTGTDGAREILDRLRQALWHAAGMTGSVDIERLPRVLSLSGGVSYAVLGPAASAAALDPTDEVDLLGEVRALSAGLTLILLAGGELWTAAGASPYTTLVVPELSTDQEDDVELWLAQIESLRPRARTEMSA